MEFIDDRLFSIKRVNTKTNEEILVVVNVSDESVQFTKVYEGTDLMTQEQIKDEFTLAPNQYRWVKKVN